MRISIRRCLSMLRNASDGNELAVPATNALEKEHSVGMLVYGYMPRLRAAWVTSCCLAVSGASTVASEL